MEEVIPEQILATTARKLQDSIKKGGAAAQELLSAQISGFEESDDIDGLIKWAKNLPDDIPNTS
jgi:hypothetical protein